MASTRSIDWARAAVLAGAGLTYDMGMPLVWELTGELKKWLTPAKLASLNHGWRAQRGGHSDEAIEFASSLLVQDGLHYESIIGRLEARYLERKESEFHALASWLTEMVCNILWLRHANNVPRLVNNTSLCRGLAILAKSATPLWVLSLNHDVCIELICDEHGAAWSNGFPPTTVQFKQDNREASSPTLEFRRLRFEDLRAGRLAFDERAHLRLVKLHGSLDIFTFDDRKELLAIPESSSARIAAITRLFRDSAFYVDGERVKAMAEFALADASGTMQFVRQTLLSGSHKFSKRLSQEAPAEFLTLSWGVLETRNELVAIGYSFGDGHINEPIVDWLSRDGARHLTIVDPFRISLPDCFSGLAPQVTLRAECAPEFLDLEAGISRTRREVAERRMLRAVRKIGDQAAASRVIETWRGAHRERFRAGLLARGSLEGDPTEIVREASGSFDENLESLAEALEQAAKR